MAGPAPWDHSGPLPTGVTVLEASAGTGKTFAIAGMAARFVAEGVPLERLLIVTFTRMATGELRERVRERLVAAERALGTHLDGSHGGAALPDDPIVDALRRGSAGEVALRRRRLARAAADFDAATITTTHAFCQRMLSGLGAGSDASEEREVVATVEDLLNEVVDDRYLRRALEETTPPFTRSEALEIARAAVHDPNTALAPAEGPPGSPASLRRRLAWTVRDELERRKRQRGVVTYDDLLTRLNAALSDPATGEGAVSLLRHRYQVVLVDEFQDTDDQQWAILERAFRSPDHTLVLIGDPKQAIYAFRGADVYAYLDAAGKATHQATLGVNWRSDQGLLDAVGGLFGNARLGHPEIVVRPVHASPAHHSPGLRSPVDAPLRVRVVHRADGGVQLTRRGHASAPSARQLIASDLAADIVRLLSNGTRLVHRDGAGAEIGSRPVAPGDIAVLTRVNRSAALWHDVLSEAGVPAVQNGAGSVFATEAGTQWLQLLEALERPSSSPRIHALSMSPWVGWSPGDVVSATDADWEELHARCHRWAAVFRRSGAAALLEVVTATAGLPQRVLGPEGGERHLTDLRHIGELLHAEATAQSLGIAALAAWLRDRIAGAGNDVDSEERSRRLESDAEAVSVLTIHRCKGLEYPVVYCPDLWEGPRVQEGRPVTYHDRDNAMRRTLDVNVGGGAAFRRHSEWHAEERAGEDLRLAYVALTRARHQTVLWWASSHDSHRSPLGRLLFGRQPDGTVAPASPAGRRDDDVARRFAELCQPIAVERASGPGPIRLRQPTAVPGRLAAASFGRRLDHAWRRTSYTALTSPAHEATVGSEPDEPSLADEAVTPARHGDTEGDEPLRDTTLPLGPLPGGTEVGSLVHATLERVDFTSADLCADVAAGIAEASKRWPVDIDRATLATGLVASIETPLGPVAGGRRLRDLDRGDRLDELAFELPLAGGDHPAGSLDLGAVADLVSSHLPPGDRLSRYPDRLRDPSLEATFRGFLTGSLDLVMRLAEPSGDRYVLADYKTNVLGDDAARRSLWDYRQEALTAAMIDTHYPLQALLYCVALHRYLRWRVPRYLPDRHLGGVLYLFLRGMTGPDDRAGACGVWAWRPPTELVLGLSDLLHEGARR